MKKLGILTLMVLCSFGMKDGNAQNTDTQMIRNLMINAKVAGMCGAIGQMTAFQKSTQMPGGNEFLVRFIKTEAARLGKDFKHFMQDCVVSSKNHGEFMRTFKDR